MKIAEITVEKLVARFGGKGKLKKAFMGKPDEGYKALLREHEALCRSYFGMGYDEVIEEDLTRIMDYCDNHLTERGKK